MASDYDPRIFWSAVRTLLAWIRTGLATIGLGFVVARFGLFLRMMHGAQDAASHAGSTLIGVGLVLLGAVAIGAAAWEHARFCRTLSSQELPRAGMHRGSLWFAAALTLVSLSLAAYLVVQASPG